MRTFIAATYIAAFTCSAAVAQEAAIPPPPIGGTARAPEGTVAIPVYGDASPGSPDSEVETAFMGRELVTRNITHPTLTPILPAAGTGNGAAVIVAPGGGYMFLSMQNEGWGVAQRLADAGYTAFVLNYRLRPTPAAEAEFYAGMREMFAAPSNADEQEKRSALEYQPAVDDALAALALVRSRAGEWGLDSARVGMIGFSAGADATLDAILQGAGRERRGSDFFGYIYGPMEAVKVPVNAPPMFAAIAYDDPLFDTSRFPLATAWHEAGRSVELHVYGRGGHGFGLGAADTTSTMMLDQFIAWMDMLDLDQGSAGE